MSVNAKVTGKFDTNHNVVEISFPKTDKTRQYKVPNNQTDMFITNYQKNDKKVSRVTNTLLVGAIFAGIIAVGLATRKIKSSVVRLCLNGLGGMVAAFGALEIGSNYIDKKHDALLKTHGAQEIDKQA